jgi:hypothetical protein
LIMTGAPLACTATLIRPGAVLAGARPICTFSVSWALLPLALAGLPMMRTCTGSIPVAFAPVQVEPVLTLPLSWMIVSVPLTPVTHRSIRLVAPPLPGAPVT